MIGTFKEKVLELLSGERGLFCVAAEADAARFPENGARRKIRQFSSQ